MDFFQELPPGLWVVKWIDRFHYRHLRAESPTLDVALQQLPFDDLAVLNRLGDTEITDLLGKRPSDNDFGDTTFVTLPLNAGFLPAVHQGFVFTRKGYVGRLPFKTRDIAIDSTTDWSYAQFGASALAPEGWTNGLPHRVLNRFEYNLQGVRRSLETRCLLVRYLGTEYIIPKIVIFRSFFALSSVLINALCSGYWDKTSNLVVSRRKYESGIETGIDGKTGAWKIVLEIGGSLNFAYTLALFLFDAYAKAQVDALYTDALRQCYGKHGVAKMNGWMANANIPHRFTLHPFEMKIQGFPLRPFKRNEKSTRFMVTSIIKSSWSLPDQAIEAELHNSNMLGEQHTIVENWDGYNFEKPPVHGNPNASATSNAPPDSKEPVNLFEMPSFEYENLPPLRRQTKKSSRSGPPKAPLSTGTSASTVSTGCMAASGSRIGPADLQTRVRSRSRQFEFLVHALYALMRENIITAFKPVPATGNFALTRNGLACWSLLQEIHRVKKSLPRKGWQLIYEDADKGTAQSKAAKVKFAYARSVLVHSITIKKSQIILIEIEPRVTACASTFSMIAFKANELFSSILLEPALTAIRENQAVFSKTELQEVFGTLATGSVVSIRHSYKHEKVSSIDPTIVAVGLDHKSLGKRLKALVSKT